MNQLSLPVEISIAEIIRQRSLGSSISLCANAAGLSGKEVQTDCRFDKAQWSRWEADLEGITWDKLVKLMDRCGNSAPVLWMVHQRGVDLNSLRPLESATEKQLRLVTEENAALRRLLRA
jgi:hypothetical protein